MPRTKGSLNKKPPHASTNTPNLSDKVDEEMIKWLEIEENRNILDGKQAGGAPHSGKGITKTEGFNRLANHINNTCGTNYNGTQMQGKFTYYKGKYIKVVAFQSSTCSGEGVTELDRMNGITTIKAKLNSLCPFYEKWEELYGESLMCALDFYQVQKIWIIWKMMNF